MKTKLTSSGTKRQYNSVSFFTNSCLLNVECQAYQYSAHDQQNCALLHRNSTQDGTTLVSHQNSKLYEKG